MSATTAVCTGAKGETSMATVINSREPPKMIMAMTMGYQKSNPMECMYRP